MWCGRGGRRCGRRWLGLQGGLRRGYKEGGQLGEGGSLGRRVHPGHGGGGGSDRDTGPDPAGEAVARAGGLAGLGFGPVGRAVFF